MTLSPSSWDIGNVLAKGKSRKTFWIKNIGTKPLVVSVRSGCDCIEIKAAPDTITPGDSARLVALYTAGEKAGPDKKSIFISSNDTEHKIIKLQVTANVIPFKLTPEAKNIAVIPFTLRVPDGKSINVRIAKQFERRAQKELGLELVSSRELALKVTNDPDYGTEEAQNIVRKWAGAFGIRYVVMGEVNPVNEDTLIVILIVDPYFSYPIIKYFRGIDRQNIPTAVFDTVKNVFANYKNEKRNATITNMQKKWAEMRKKLIGKKAPAISMKNVVTGKRTTLDDFKGKPIVMHFFSVDCEHCHDEIVWLSSLVKKYPGIEGIGVSVDLGEEDTVKAFVDSAGIPYPVLLPTSDESFQLDAYYGGATPQSIIIDPDGKIVDVMVGFNRTINRRFDTMLENMLNKGGK